MPKLLVIDDESAILHAFRRAFAEAEVFTAGSAAEGLSLATAEKPDVIVLDINLPDLNGLEALTQLRRIDPRSLVVFITGKTTTDTAIEAMKRGAFDYLLKPLELSHLRQVIEKAFDISRLMRVPTILAPMEPVDDRADAIVGRCPAMQEVYKAIGRVAPQDVTVLITGASGTGKELVARALYGHSSRAKAPFLAINGAAIPEHLLESELFGHEKGAFTGADRRRIGKFEQCSGGTLFLDEVADLSPLTQSKLLRVLQEGTFERLGGNETIKVTVRILAATNRDLGSLVAAGRFREDLFYRLSVFTIALPTLAQRAGDLELIVAHYLHRFGKELHKSIQTVSPETMEILKKHSWPGNIRELQSVLKQALLNVSGPVLAPAFLPRSLTSTEVKNDGKCHADTLERFMDEQLALEGGNLYAECLARMERQLLTKVLAQVGGNQVRAAKILGITRGSLRNKLRELGLSIDKSVQSARPE